MSTMSDEGLADKILGGLRDFIAALIVLYGLCTTAYIILHVLVGEQVSLVALLNNLMPMLLVPAIPLVLLCAVLGRFRLSLALAPAVLMLVIGYGALLMPGRARAATEAQPLTLLTFNLHGGWQTNGSAPILDLVKQADADVVALQEFSPEVVQALEPLYPYRAVHANKDSHVENQGVLSRYPILADDYWVIGLGMQRVVLDVNGKHVTLYNVHIQNPLVREANETRVDVSRRDRMIDDLLSRTANENNPLIIAGDFNMTDQTDGYKRISARYHDTFRDVGSWLGFTFPADHRLLPMLVRIDYVFHDDHVQSVMARAWPTSGGSDHRPVWVKLSLSGF